MIIFNKVNSWTLRLEDAVRLKLTRSELMMTRLLLDGTGRSFKRQSTPHECNQFSVILIILGIVSSFYWLLLILRSSEFLIAFSFMVSIVFIYILSVPDVLYHFRWML